MNILPHKSWHVWRRENIAKVERDEANHRKELEEQKKNALAEQRKKRFEQLQGRTGNEDLPVTEPQSQSKPAKERYHLFSDIEKKYEIEKKKVRNS